MVNQYSPYVLPSSGQDFATQFLAKRTNSAQFGDTNRLKNAQETALDIADKSAGNIPIDQYGLVKDTQAVKPGDLTNTFNTIDRSATKVGSLAADAEVAKNQWNQLKQAQDLAASYKVQAQQGNSGAYSPVANTSDLATGGSTASQSKGQQAVSLAMQAYNNKTPYVWGGNSLTKGIDCSGLVQQVYSQLGVSVPRTTYEQAKSGQIVNLNSLMPGDLVFYNTGGSDPNGIGQYSHVAIYTGNGNIVDARNSRSGIKSGSIYDAGTPVLGVRPW